jgi:uncharacterized membrane protein
MSNLRPELVWEIDIRDAISGNASQAINNASFWAAREDVSAIIKGETSIRVNGVITVIMRGVGASDWLISRRYVSMMNNG